MKNLWRQAMRYRMPLLLGAGGVVIFTAYNRQRQAQAAAVAGASPAAVAAVAEGRTAEALAMQAAAYQAGGGLGLQGAELGLRPTESALNLAGLATMGAQAVSGDVIGLATSLGGFLSDLATTAVEALPDLSPSPAPVAAAPTAPAPTAPAPTAPAPPPAAPTVVSQATEHMVVMDLQGGWVQYFSVRADGAILDRRRTSFGLGSWAPVEPRRDGGVVHYRTTAGGMAGWSVIPGGPGNCSADWGGPPSCGAFHIERRVVDRYSDGRTVAGAWSRIA